MKENHFLTFPQINNLFLIIPFNRLMEDVSAEGNLKKLALANGFTITQRTDIKDLYIYISGEIENNPFELGVKLYLVRCR